MNERNVDLTHKSYQEQTRQGNQGFEVINSYMSHKLIWTDYNASAWYSLKNQLKLLGEQATDLRRYRWRKRHGLERKTIEKGKGKGPILVLGSGPSLDDYIREMRNWPHAIMCSNSQASTLRYYGADPMYLLIFDAKAKSGDTLCADSWNYDRTTLLTSPTCAPKFLRDWPGAVRYYQTQDPYDDWYTKALDLAYYFVDQYHAPFACSLAAQIGLATFMGYGPIYLFGADLGFPIGGELSRFTCYRYRDKVWTKSQARAHDAEKWDIEAGFGSAGTADGFRTDGLTLFYRRTILALTYLDAPAIISCSNGLLNGLLPQDDGHEVLRDNLTTVPWSKEKLRSQLGPWLAANAQFWISLGEDAQKRPVRKLVEANNWRVELPAMLHLIKEAGEPVDIDAEMERAEAYIAEAKRRGYTIFCEPEHKPTP